MVIDSNPKHEIETFNGLLGTLGHIPPFHRPYGTNVPRSFFADGNGEVTAS